MRSLISGAARFVQEEKKPPHSKYIGAQHKLDLLLMHCRLKELISMCSLKHCKSIYILGSVKKIAVNELWRSKVMTEIENL